MSSIWERGVELPSFETVKSDKKVDVLVIGGGMAGLLCGYFLQSKGAKYAVIEKDRIAGGVTRNTTAKITLQHGLIYSRLCQDFGQEKAAAYLKANELALAQYKKMAATIDCDFEEKTNFIYTTEDKAKILDEVEAVNQIGGKAIYTEQVEVPYKIEAAIGFAQQAQFHPLKFISAIAPDLSIYEESFAAKIEKEHFGYSVTVINAQGNTVKINADRVITATHFPFVDKYGMYFMKMYQQRSYVLVLKNAAKLDGMYIGNRQKGDKLHNLSFRTYKDHLLLGGCGSRTGTKCGAFDELREAAKTYYPESREVAAWATQDCMTLDGLPYIGRYAKKKDGLYVATGFNKWGMTSSMAAAMLLTGNMDKELADVFRPDRSMMKPQLFINGMETAKNFVKPVGHRCTHLGCALKWNKAEKTWDCPCHGSRFEEDGEVINNPAQKNLKG